MRPATVAQRPLTPPVALGPLQAGPQSIVSGAIYGTKGLLTGVGVGVVGLVSAPILGTAAGASGGDIVGGVAGACVGTVMGAAVLVVGVIGGAGSAITNLVVGTIRTPATLVAIITDDDLHGKTPIRLAEIDISPDVPSALDGNQAAADSGVFSPTANVKERGLYDALGIEPDTPMSDVRKAYYRCAMKEHPDKGGDAAKFQEVGSAYAVLSDPDKRRAYDHEGSSALRNDLSSSASEIFASMFGDGRFVHLMGELTMVTSERLQKEAAGQGAAQIQARVEAAHRKRVLQLAKALAQRLEAWVSGDTDAFRTGAQAEYESLLTAHFGPEILRAIGMQYELAADRALGLQGSDWFGTTASTHRTELVARGMLSMFRVAQDSAALDASLEGLDAEAQARAREEFTEKMKLALFKFVASDIEDAVCAAVCMRRVHVHVACGMCRRVCLCTRTFVRMGMGMRVRVRMTCTWRYMPHICACVCRGGSHVSVRTPGALRTHGWCPRLKENAYSLYQSHVRRPFNVNVRM